MEIQLRQIYYKFGSDIDICLVNPVLQTNNSDCGVYAIANAVEFATNQLHCWFFEKRSDWIYDECSMRSHLVKCFEDGVLTPFAKLKRKRSSSVIPKIHKIKIKSPCGHPDFFHPEMACFAK